MVQGVELVISRDGPDGEKRFVLRPGVDIRIGRHADSQIQVDFDGVSGKHAELFLGVASQGVMPLLVRDVSKNGTAVRPGPDADAQAWADPKAPPPWQRLENGMPRPVEAGWQLMVPAKSRKERDSTNKPAQLTQQLRTLTIVRITAFEIEDPKPAPVQRLTKAPATVEESEEAEREALARLMEDAPAAPEALAAGASLAADDVAARRKKRKDGKKEKTKDGEGKPGKKDKERKKNKDRDAAGKAPLPAGVADVMDEIDQELAYSVGKPKAGASGVAAAPPPPQGGEDAPRSARPKRGARPGDAVGTPEGAAEHMMRVVQKAAGARGRGEAPAEAPAAVPGPGQRELRSPRPARRGGAAAPAAPRLTEASLAAAGVGLPSAGAIESELRSVSPISTPGVFPWQQQAAQQKPPKKKRKADASPGAEKRRRRRQK